MRVEVVAAQPGGTVQRRTVELPEGATVADVLSAAAIKVAHGCAVAVHGRIKSANECLNDGDRLEICQPLTADPKQARRSRARMNRNERR